MSESVKTQSRLDALTSATRRSAHEISNILTILRMNADLVEQALMETKGSTSEIREIQSAAERLRDLAGSLLVSAHQPATRNAPARPARPVGPLARCNTILVVEDEPAIRALARRILSGQAFRVLEAEDGAAALRVAAGEVGEIDLVLTDVEMPTLGGPGLVQELQELSPDVRVLFMSGYSDFELLRRGFTSAVDSLLKKPFTGTTLVAAVRAALAAPVGQQA